MFIDKVDIHVKAGNGGDGAVAWRREKYEPSGGPAGGDGGDGGDIVFVGDENLQTLLDFRYKRKYKGNHGENGQGKKMFGKKGEDLKIRVPLGTLVKDRETQGVIADIREHGEEYVVAVGGRGGKGNARYATSTRQSPGFAQAGTVGEERDLTLELKLIADVGLIGFPNVGKSTILSIVTAAKPKIANYHFTTLQPNLGVVQVDDQQSFVMADIPGLIEGAAEGVGLGHDFLRHVERTRLLIHVLDMSGSEARDPYEDYQKIREELTQYNEKLADRKEIIFANKMELPGAEENLATFKEKLDDEDIPILSGSAAMNDGLQELLYKTWELLQDIPKEVESFDEVYVAPEKVEEPFTAYEEDGVFYVTGKEADLLLRSTYFDDVDSVRHFQMMLEKKGIIDALTELGIQTGDTVNFCGYEFDYIDQEDFDDYK